MQRNHAFTLAEMWTAIALVGLALIFAHSMVGCGGSGTSRQQARRMQNNANVRGIHSAMVLFCAGNRDHYPGVDANGTLVTNPIPAKPGLYGTNSTNGAEVVYRIAILVQGNYFPLEYLRSPDETNAAIVPIPLPNSLSPDAGVVKENHYSYAMLNISDRQAPRSREWRATSNSRAPVISDRNISAGTASRDGVRAPTTGRFVQSNYTDLGDGWKGSVCWNDNHTTFEDSDALKTEYDLKGEVAADALFSDKDTSANGVADADAAMVFTSDNRYFSQQPPNNP